MQDGAEYRSQISLFFRRKEIILTLVIDLLLILGAILIRSHSEISGNTYIELFITPIDATVSIDGNSEKYSEGTYRVSPGKHRIIISKEGLQEKSFDLDLDTESYTAISAFLTGDNNDLDYYIKKGNRSSFLRLKQITETTNLNSTEENESASKFVSKYSESYYGLSKLPLEKHYYREVSSGNRAREVEKSIYIRADDGSNCETDYCLIAILGGNATEKDALNLIQENGLKAEGYEINYKKF